jgi:hypothetical protein
MKVCTKCKVEKPLTDFRVRKNRKSGYRSDCKSCEYQYSRNNRKEYFNNYQKNKRKTDSLYNLSWVVRCSITQSFKRACEGRYIKSKRSEDILGCTLDFFMNYISLQFKDGMSFERMSEIHLDHIIPISSAKTEEDIIRLNHYTNFQPLWAKDNFKKSNKIIEKQLKLI